MCSGDRDNTLMQSLGLSLGWKWSPLGTITLQTCNDGKEMYKKARCTCKVVVLRNKPIAFLPFSLPSPSSLLKLPKEASSEERNWFPYNRPNRPNRPKFPKLKSLVSRRLYGTEPDLINCSQIYSSPVNMKLVYYLPSIRRVDWTWQQRRLQQV